ncbi:MAG: hypothetical protein O7F12_05595, partial [Nitrospirae bacterium]|nr:hypothetical protein [Nitrospirota bacterium]
DSCPAVIIWNPVADAARQKITVEQGSKIMCLDHNLTGTADIFPCDKIKPHVRVDILLEWVTKNRHYDFDKTDCKN